MSPIGSAEAPPANAGFTLLETVCAVAIVGLGVAVTARIAADGHGVEAGASTRALHLPADITLRLAPATGCGPDDVMHFDALGHSCGGALLLSNGIARLAVRVSPATGGVSLAEVVATLLLTGLLLSMLTTATGQGLAGWGRAGHRVARSEALALALDAIAHDLEAALVLSPQSKEEPRSFVGTATTVRVVCARDLLAEVAGLETVEIGETDGNVWRAARSGIGSSGPREVLLAGAVLTLAYSTDGKDWREVWNMPQPPAVVRLHLSLADRPGARLVRDVALRVDVSADCVTAHTLAECRARPAAASGSETGARPWR